MTAGDVLNFIYNNNLIDSFPNATISLKIYLSLPVTVASAERSFSELKIIKTLPTIINKPRTVVEFVKNCNRKRRIR